MAMDNYIGARVYFWDSIRVLGIWRPGFTRDWIQEGVTLNTPQIRDLNTRN
jgi:hypothetical protein